MIGNIRLQKTLHNLVTSSNFWKEKAPVTDVFGKTYYFIIFRFKHFSPEYLFIRNHRNVWKIVFLVYSLVQLAFPRFVIYVN